MSSAKPQPLPAARRTPVQERSNDTVQQILKAASTLLGRLPLEQITTSTIAREAGVSIGALYRFFPDKQAIVDAIAVRHVEDLQQLLMQRMVEVEVESAPAFLNLVIDAYVAFLDERPDFRTIALGRHVSALTRQAQAAPDSGPAALVRLFLETQSAGHDPAALDLKMRMSIETGEHLIAYAFQQCSRNERDRVIAEMKTILARYLFP